jgi:hypothetical protein
MNEYGRRKFLGTCGSATGLWIADLQFLQPISRAIAQETTAPRDWLQPGLEIAPIVRLIHSTPRADCVEVFVKELKNGLTYQRFLAALFLTASETGDLHQLAQIYAAHRTSESARVEERLLPLFWALDRIKQGHEAEDKSHFLSDLKGPLPKANEAANAFHDGMKTADKSQVEGAIIALARNEGPRHAMNRLWNSSAKDLGGTLGHLPIGVANAWRTLDTIGWQYAEPGLRYLARETCRPKADNTFAANEQRLKRSLAQLPPNWASRQGNRSVTLELYKILRSADADAAGDFICATLISKKASAGAIWDAISLAAADLIFRHRIGGNVIGGALIHAITSTNALRYGFGLVANHETRLIQLLQAAGSVAEGFIGRAAKDQGLRKLDLIDDLNQSDPTETVTVREIFEQLPEKGDSYGQQDPSERAASDQACQAAFQFLQQAGTAQPFMQTARTLLCIKASTDPHDFKYPAAAFEDAFLASPEWRPYLLASSVHALHGVKSPDSEMLLRARSAI